MREVEPEPPCVRKREEEEEVLRLISLPPVVLAEAEAGRSQEEEACVCEGGRAACRVPLRAVCQGSP